MKYIFKTIICLFFAMFTTITYAQGLPGAAQGEEGEKYLKAGEIDKAIDSFKAAVNLGHFFSLYDLGNIYRDEMGDYSKAIDYFNQYIAAFIEWKKGGIDHNDSLCISSMYISNGNFYLADGDKHGLEMDVAKVVMYYEKALKYDAAQREEIFSLGLKFMMGAFGLPQDEKRAIHLYRRAYEYGRKETAFDLGLCYKYGWGVDKDYQTAIKWFATVLQNEKDHAGALGELGDCYYNGLGVETNYTKAFQYLNKAAEMDDELAMRHLAQYYEDQAKDEKKAFFGSVAIVRG